MSAWTVSHRHIDALVLWLERAGLIKPQDKTKVGKMLWSENYRSIRARYGSYDRDGAFVARPPYVWREPKPDTFNRYYDLFDPNDKDQAQALVHCYDYQSCETMDYETTRSARLMRKLDGWLVSQGADWKREGIKTPWGI